MADLERLLRDASRGDVEAWNDALRRAQRENEDELLKELASIALFQKTQWRNAEAKAMHARARPLSTGKKVHYSVELHLEDVVFGYEQKRLLDLRGERAYQTFAANPEGFYNAAHERLLSVTVRIDGVHVDPLNFRSLDRLTETTVRWLPFVLVNNGLALSTNEAVRMMSSRRVVVNGHEITDRATQLEPGTHTIECGYKTIQVTVEETS